MTRPPNKKQLKIAMIHLQKAQKSIDRLKDTSASIALDNVIDYLYVEIEEY